MKSRLYLTGAWVIITATYIILSAWYPVLDVLGFIALLLWSSFMCVFVWDIIGIVKMWKRFRLWSLLPLGFLLLLPSIVVGISGAFGSHLQLKRFKSHLSEYKAIIDMISGNDIAEMKSRNMTIRDGTNLNYMFIKLPDDLHYLGWYIRVRQDERDNNPSIMFNYGGSIKYHYSYVYRADGDFEKALTQFNLQKIGSINSNWCEAKGFSPLFSP
jgi:hypothetical protein